MNDWKIANAYFICPFDDKNNSNRLNKNYQRILDSDFLISDDKCTHRLVGLRYTGPEMYSPVITVCCMRHEMAYAKQIAYSAGKKIYFDTKSSAKLFSRYAVGDDIDAEDFMCVVGYYADHYKRMGYALESELEY